MIYTLCICSYLAAFFINSSAELEIAKAVFLSSSYTKIPCLWRNENLRPTLSTGMGIWRILRWVSLEQKIKVMEGKVEVKLEVLRVQEERSLNDSDPENPSFEDSICNSK